jgi:hypothetical protein
MAFAPALPKSDDDALAQVREQAHEAVDAWLDALTPLLSGGQPPTLSALSDYFCASRPKLFGTCQQAVLDHIVRTCDQLARTDCPRCDRRLYRKRWEEKQLTTLHGASRLRRAYFYCAKCRYGFHPLDFALELATETHQYDVQQKVASLAIELPYATAVTQFESLTSVKVGEHMSHDSVNRLAQATALETVLPDGAEIARRIAAASTCAEKPVLVVAVDGVMTPVRPPGGRSKKRGAGSWREAKGFRLYLSRSDGRIDSLASWHQIEGAEQLGQDLLVAASRIPLDKVEVALVGDGAAWVWNTMLGAFPKAHQVLDHYHCCEHLWKVASLQHQNPESARAWVDGTLARLSMGHVSHVIGGLRRTQPASPEATLEIDKLIGYLSTHCDRLAYDEAKAKGLPIGSGGIESANKFIVQARLKRSGAWWLEPNGNGMLRLRCAIVNRTFDRVFNNYVKLRQKFLSDRNE